MAIEYFFDSKPYFDSFVNPFIFNNDYCYFAIVENYKVPIWFIYQDYYIRYYMGFFFWEDIYTRFVYMNEFWNHYNWYRTMTPSYCWWKFGQYGRWTMCAGCFQRPYRHHYGNFWYFLAFWDACMHHWVAWIWGTGIYGPLRRFFIFKPGWPPIHTFWYFIPFLKSTRIYHLGSIMDSGSLWTIKGRVSSLTESTIWPHYIFWDFRNLLAYIISHVGFIHFIPKCINPYFQYSFKAFSYDIDGLMVIIVYIINISFYYCILWFILNRVYLKKILYYIINLLII
jgi:hypothetical protein